MPFLALGVEHRTAPIAIRERAALEEDVAARTLAEHPAISEAAIVSTCNRTEIYLFADEIEEAATVAGDLLAADPAVRPYIQRWDDLAVADHLFRVASGLESQLVGEREVLGQVRAALERGERLATIGPNLHSLLRSAIRCARQARAGTGFGRMQGSLPAEAVRNLRSQLGGFEDRSVLVIGGGATARLVLQELTESGAGEILVANRTFERADQLARHVGGRAVPLAEVPSLLSRIDVLLSATAARRYVLTPAMLSQEILAARPRPLYIADLAIPRDVDPAIAALPSVVLHDLDQLVPPDGRAVDEAEIGKMEATIAAAVHEFEVWCLTRRAVPVIASLRSHVEAVHRQEMERVAPLLRDLTDRERAAVESLTGRLIDKMFHHLVVRLRLAAQTDPRLVEAAEFFFLHGEGGLFPHAEERPQEVPSEVEG